MDRKIQILMILKFENKNVSNIKGIDDIDFDKIVLSNKVSFDKEILNVLFDIKMQRCFFENGCIESRF